MKARTPLRRRARSGSMGDLWQLLGIGIGACVLYALPEVIRVRGARQDRLLALRDEVESAMLLEWRKGAAPSWHAYFFSYGTDSVRAFITQSRVDASLEVRYDGSKWVVVRTERYRSLRGSGRTFELALSDLAGAKYGDVRMAHLQAREFECSHMVRQWVWYGAYDGDFTRVVLYPGGVPTGGRSGGWGDDI